MDSLERKNLDYICTEIDSIYQSENKIEENSLTTIIEFLKLDVTDKINSDIDLLGNKAMFGNSRESYTKSSLESKMMGYGRFMNEYIELKKGKNNLPALNKEENNGITLESKNGAEIKIEFSKGNYFWNALWGGLAASSLSDIGSIADNYKGLIGAGIGVALTTYANNSKYKPSLGPVFWGTILGGIAGSLVDNPETAKLGQYIGAGIGATIGLFKSFKEGKEKYLQIENKRNEDIKLLENRFDESKKKLYDKYLKMGIYN